MGSKNESSFQLGPWKVWNWFLFRLTPTLAWGINAESHCGWVTCFTRKHRRGGVGPAVDKLGMRTTLFRQDCILPDCSLCCRSSFPLPESTMASAHPLGSHPQLTNRAGWSPPGPTQCTHSAGYSVSISQVVLSGNRDPVLATVF